MGAKNPLFLLVKMDIKRIEEKTYNLLEDYLQSLGYELVFVEFTNENRGWVLRLYIDKEDGVNIDDCVKVSETVDPLLDVEDFIKASYNLEVSSPGVNRPLRKREHFEKVIGEKIKVVLKEPLENKRRNFKGKLIDVKSDSILMEVKNGDIEFLLKDIKKANLIYKF